ncbi:NAD-dependent epimerase/dehydratase family protein [Pelagibacteraceae bacterium]|nr:NAD-dependent epimerase/dehydratase family protein [Pelagibacteraceae bacterium]
MSSNLKLKVLLTGSNGFVGSKILEELKKSCHEIVPIYRKDIDNRNIDQNTNWKDFLKNVDCIIHTAARAHIIKEISKDPIAEFRKVNVEGTINLANQAVKAGVKRFIFISTIKVNGEFNKINSPMVEELECYPSDAYSCSKYEAEIALQSIAKKTNLEIVIIRPPLVYGPKVKANFESLINLVKKRIPLPFRYSYNRRSYISLTNLVDFIILCIQNPRAKNEIFLISDDHDLSIEDLVMKISKHCETRVILFPIPVKILSIILRNTKFNDYLNKLYGNLTVDISKAKTLLSWKPKISVDEGIKKIFNN